MTRLFLSLAFVCSLALGSMTMVGCGETAAVNKPAPANAGSAPDEGAAKEDSATVDN